VRQRFSTPRKLKNQKFFASFFQKRRFFFSEEKKQKTFISCAVWGVT
jgi:hypothetical protein